MTPDEEVYAEQAQGYEDAEDIALVAERRELAAYFRALAPEAGSLVDGVRAAALLDPDSPEAL